MRFFVLYTKTYFVWGPKSKQKDTNHCKFPITQSLKSPRIFLVTSDAKIYIILYKYIIQ